MAWKFKYGSKDEVPAEQAGLYVERDGAWLLDAEGVVEKARADEMRTKLEEFRSSNVSLINENLELKKRFEGIDPEDVKRLGEEIIRHRRRSTCTIARAKTTRMPT